MNVPARLAALAAITILLAAPAARAGTPDFRRYGRWVSAALGGGGYIQQVIPTADPRVYYARVDVGGVARSDDAGQSWHLLHGNVRPYVPGIDAVRGVGVDPRDPDKLVIAAGDRWSEAVGLLASDDGGDSWTLVQPGLFLGNAGSRNAGDVLARHPDRPDAIYAAGVGRNFRSDDNGRSWREFGPTGLHATDLTIDHADPDRLWLAATSERIYVSDLGGPTDFAGGWFLSEDGGDSFDKLADDAPREFVQDPRDPDTLYGLFDIHSLRRSDDAGRTWHDFADGLPLDAAGGFDDWATTSTALTAADDRLVLVTRDGTVFERPYDAAAWREVGPESVDGRGWYGNLGDRPGWVHYGKSAGDVLVSPHDPSLWFFTDWYAVWRSEDAGRTWAYSADGLEVTVVHSIVGHPGDGALVHLGMADNGYLRSTDGGASFDDLHGLPVGEANVKAIAVAPSDSNRVYLTGNTTPGEWAARGLAASADAGQTWAAAPMRGLPDMSGRMMCSVAVDPADAMRVAVGVSGDGPGAYVSTDGGASFGPMADGLPEDGYFRNDIWVCGRELAVGPGGHAVAFSHDRRLVHRLAGDAWTSAGIEVRGKPNDVAADPATAGRFFLAVGDDGLYRTDNGGATFERVWDGDARRVAIEGDRVAVGVGTDAGVVHSDDGGVTFSTLDDALPNRDRPVVAFAGAGFGRVLAGTNGNGTFYLPLSAADAAPQRAAFADDPPATRPAFDQDGPDAEDEGVFPDGDMAALDGWKIVYTGEGELDLSLDDEHAASPPTSLKLSSVGGPAYGTAGFRLPDDVAELTIIGRVRGDGELGECFVAVQSFDAENGQVRFDILARPTGDGEWRRFEKTLTRPADARSWSLVLILRGQGGLRLDDLAATDVRRE